MVWNFHLSQKIKAHLISHAVISPWVTPARCNTWIKSYVSPHRQKQILPRSRSSCLRSLLQRILTVSLWTFPSRTFASTRLWLRLALAASLINSPKYSTASSDFPWLKQRTETKWNIYSNGFFKCWRSAPLFWNNFVMTHPWLDFISKWPSALPVLSPMRLHTECLRAKLDPFNKIEQNFLSEYCTYFKAKNKNTGGWFNRAFGPSIILFFFYWAADVIFNSAGPDKIGEGGTKTFFQ